ncbi:putative ABC transporter B family member 8 [Glycine soja]
MGSPKMDESETRKLEMERKERASIETILRYADWIDVVLVLMGAVGAIGDGMSTNCNLYFVYLGLATMVVAFKEGYCWSKTSERQALRIRYKYLEAVLRQEVGFFDSQEAIKETKMSKCRRST